MDKNGALDTGGMNVVYHSVNDLVMSEYNPRELTKHQHKQLIESLENFNWVVPIVINKNTARHNVVVGGHQRLKVAKQLGYKKVPCVEVDLPLVKEKELNIRLNQNTGQWDYDALANNFDVDKLLDWGFDAKELGWNDAPTNDDWAAYFEEKGDTSGVDGRHQITFVLNTKELESLKTKLGKLDKNKNKAIMLLIDDQT